MIQKATITVCIILLVSACKKKPEVSHHVAKEHEPVLVSLSGVRYYEPEWSETVRAKLDSNLWVAQKNFEENPTEENYIWLGRRLAYLYEYDSAIKVFSEGIQKFPDSYKLLRHRGHRYITIRKFDDAINDLERATELMKGTAIEMEPDGAPNKYNIQLSNTQFNVWYHLGLAHYLKGEFGKAEGAYQECLKVSNNDDLLAATVDWLYMTYRRAGKHTEAKKLLTLIPDEMHIIENESYFRRLNLYKGKLKPEEVLNVSDGEEDADLLVATQGYGVGNWYLVNGDTARANEIFEKVVEGKHFSAFGFIAAEVELIAAGSYTNRR
jgi:tetratricopeptide (TPR) repeat protein